MTLVEARHALEEQNVDAVAKKISQEQGIHSFKHTGRWWLGAANQTHKDTHTPSYIALCAKETSFCWARVKS